MKYILSYGGGINSSALFFFLLERSMPIDLLIFADTGEEMPETYDAVERMKKRCADHNIEFVTVRSAKGRLVDYYRKNKAMPSRMRKDCTSKFKISPIRKYLRARFGKKERFTMYIGFAFDEVHRMKDSNVKYIENSYPFCDAKILRKGNIDILDRHGFKAEKSGCRGCIWQKLSEFRRLWRDDPEEYDRWMMMEEACSRFPEFTLFSKGRTLRQLKEDFKTQTDLSSFDEEIEPPCDVAGGCFQ